VVWLMDRIGNPNDEVGHSDEQHTQPAIYEPHNTYSLTSPSFNLSIGVQFADRNCIHQPEDLVIAPQSTISNPMVLTTTPNNRARSWSDAPLGLFAESPETRFYPGGGWREMRSVRFRSVGRAFGAARVRPIIDFRDTL